MDNTKTNSYTADNIKAVEGIDHIKLRPSMYIGSTDLKGMHHLVWEIVDNSIDEVLAGYADKVIVELLDNNYIKISDNGRGIPVSINSEKGISALQMVFTIPNAGGKFDSDSYKVSGGLHGVGATVTNALSVHLKAEVYRDGKSYIQEYNKGIPLYDTKETGDSNLNGTVVTFKPDKDIFSDDPQFDYNLIKERLRQSSFLNKKTHIILIDSRNNQSISEEFYSENGLVDYIKFLNEGKNIKFPLSNTDKKQSKKAKKPLNTDSDDENIEESENSSKNNTDGIDSPIFFVNETANNVKVSRKTENIEVEAAFQYSPTSYDTIIVGFANNVRTSDGGTHIDGLKDAISSTLKNYIKEIQKKDLPVSTSDTQEGLTAVISVKLYEPEFEGQTKTKLGTKEVRGVVKDFVSNNFNKFLVENPEIGRVLTEKTLTALSAREAAEKAREKIRRKNPLDNIGFASKLADCRSKDPNVSELYIVEGNSAGGSAKQGRDSEYQAILPLRGKVLNVEKALESKALDNNEIVSLIKAIGTDFGNNFDITKARYKKIVIMTDADVDGSHIRTLLLTFFFRMMRDLINEGYIYFAQPPLYKLQAGNKIEYVYSENEIDKAKENFGSRYSIQRYKGLGEMDPSQLWETTMDPKERILLQVTMDEAEIADKVFSELMGDDVLPRKIFIQANAQYAKNIDL